MRLAAPEQMRELDRKATEEHGIPSIDLMERAAAGVCRETLALLPERPGKCRAAVFCGAGNNGGDGIAAARMLHLSGVKARVFLAGQYERLTPDALEETRRLSECGVELEPFDPEDKGQRAWVRKCHVIIDALFGVGLTREIAPDSLFAAAIEWINRSPGKVIAADIASGIDAGTGERKGYAVRADVTVTFTLPKIGLAVGDGALYSGRVVVEDIGIPAGLTRELSCAFQTVGEDLARAALPARKPDGHKGDFGRVLVIGGSAGYTGAPFLTASAAVRSGCGLVYLGVPNTVWPVLAVKCTSAMPFPLPDQDGGLKLEAVPEILRRMESCDVLAIGPGLGRNPETLEAVREVLRETEKPVVLDADGINALEGHIDILDSRRDRVTILTPHEGEMARICQNVRQEDRLGWVNNFAREHPCITVLKGHRTITAVNTGSAVNTLVNTTGNSGLAKGGSGDVLTGLIASLLAQGASPVMAAAGGVWMHGYAGDLAAADLTPWHMTPEDVINRFPEVFAALQ
jgi:NAD(P)H-hydrate epimerase